MDMNPNIEALRSLPQVDEVLNHANLQPAIESVGREAAADSVRATIDSVRAKLLAGDAAITDTEAIAVDACNRACALTEPSLRRVVNASGVIIHTNLGRSALAEPAIDAVNQVICGYSTLEYDTAAMARGSRHGHCEPLICALTGAEAAIAVNNNAAAVLMVLTEFAAGREAVVSRGELVEIGGSFRIPDIMALSHARMVEVGTTNKTHESDYERALSPETAMLMKVHPSNYRMVGFTESVGIAQLRKLADAHELENGTHPLVYEDQGSGAFLHLEAFGAYAEPTVAASLTAGADLVSFSGDKLLGGPQAGIIVGRRALIDRLKASPLARALRLDKMTLAALEATLRLYLHPGEALRQIPTLRMLTEGAASVKTRSEKLLGMLEKLLPDDCAELSVVAETSRAGGGSLPMCDIPTYAVEMRFVRGDAQDCASHLARKCPIPIVGRINHEALLFDTRTLASEDELKLVAGGVASYFETLE